MSPTTIHVFVAVQIAVAVEYCTRNLGVAAVAPVETTVTPVSP